MLPLGVKLLLEKRLFLGIITCLSRQQYLSRVVTRIHTRVLSCSSSSYSSSSSRWLSRQKNDSSRLRAKDAGLQSRAALKLLEIDEKYHIFQRGQNVIDLGFAPGSWSQVREMVTRQQSHLQYEIALDRTRPDGRLIGVDLLPAHAPIGALSMQGDFLQPDVRSQILALLQRTTNKELGSQLTKGQIQETNNSQSQNIVDILLSDMMVNTSGSRFRDHVGSMDLCNAALDFGLDALKVGGHFICKFYQGSEDRALEHRLRQHFVDVHRDKPKSSRSESKEAYFVALKRIFTP